MTQQLDSISGSVFYDYGKLSFYPHMAQNDIAVWEKFLQLNPDAFVKVAYDVKIGQGQPADKSYPESMQKMQLDLTKKRIDALGLSATGDAIIIEIKDRAGLSAIGQVQSYETLFNIDYPDLRTSKMIICDNADPDIITVAKTFNIDLVIV